MKAVDTRPTESAINNHIITSNSTTQLTNEIRDVITFNNPPTINVTYNNQVALAIDNTETDLPKDDSYITTDKGIFKFFTNKAAVIHPEDPPPTIQIDSTFIIFVSEREALLIFICVPGRKFFK